MSTPDVVLLDLDGTVVDSYPGIYRCLRFALPSVGLGDITDEQLRAFLGPPLKYSLMEVHGKTEEQVAEFLRVYRSVYFGDGEYEFEVFPGMSELIADIAASNVILSLATAKPIPSATRVLTQAGLLQHFDFIAGSEMDLSRQDKPSIIAYAIEHVGRDLTNVHAMMVGDRKEDIAGAKAHGLRTVGATWGYAEPGELASADADYLVSTADELRALIFPS